MKRSFLLSAMMMALVSAFQTPTRIPRMSRSTILRMSEVAPKEESFWEPPPPPEDTLTLGGDMVALFVYGFTDHFLCSDIGNYFIQQNSDSPQKLLAAADSTQTALNTPVWIEPESIAQVTKTMQLQLSDTLVTHYSPVLQTTGMATCLLAGSWLVAGWLHNAFSYQNTLNCRTETALKVTAKAWLTSCAIMMTIVSASHIVCGCDVFFTRGDTDYIFDSLSVLCLWRFIVSSMLGNARD